MPPRAWPRSKAASARLSGLRTELRRMIKACHDGCIAECRVIKVLALLRRFGALAAGRLFSICLSVG